MLVLTEHMILDFPEFRVKQDKKYAGGCMSEGQKNLSEYLQQRYGLECESNFRGWNPENPQMEIDIYFPSKKVGIEYHGTRYHSTKFHADKYRHARKAEAAEKNDIKLYQIYDFEWQSKSKWAVWEKILDYEFKHEIQKNNVLDAKDLDVFFVPTRTKIRWVRDFVENNSITPYRGGRYRILFTRNVGYGKRQQEIVGALVARKTGEGGAVITHVTGLENVRYGFGTLFRHMIKKYPEIKWCDLLLDKRIGNGHYPCGLVVEAESAGFWFVGDKEPGYINVSANGKPGCGDYKLYDAGYRVLRWFG